jgi:type IV secretion system protein VirB10
VPLASPGTDELGRSGLSGSIDWHWWQRFGSALLISVIDGAIQAATQRSDSATVQLNPSGASDVIANILRSDMDVAPTVNKPEGDRIQILVARDVDFRSVYVLRDRTIGGHP